jgi:CBS-domain-containing membrane protein
MLAPHKSFETLTAADVMSRDVMVIPARMDLRTAAHLLSQSRVSGAPVVNHAGVCVGVISTTDFVHWAEGQGACPRRSDAESVCSDWQVVQADETPAHSVSSYMTPDPVMAGQRASLATLAGKMIDAHIHRVIIVDDQEHPVGIVSTTDILAALARNEET